MTIRQDLIKAYQDDAQRASGTACSWRRTGPAGRAFSAQLPSLR